MADSVTLILAQFGPEAENLNPTLSGMRKYFPVLRVVLYTDEDQGQREAHNLDELIVVEETFPRGPRYGNRMNDYWKVRGLLEQSGEVRIAMDTDMLITSSRVTALTDLTKRFGLCLPANPRLLVSEDARIGTDGGELVEPGLRAMHAVNMSPIAFSKFRASGAAEKCLEYYLSLMETMPQRGPS